MFLPWLGEGRGGPGSVLWISVQQEQAGEGLEAWRAFGVHTPGQSWLGGMEKCRQCRSA